MIRWTLLNSRKISRIQETSGLVFCFSPLSFISTFLWRLFLSCCFFSAFLFCLLSGWAPFCNSHWVFWLYLWSYIYIPLLFYVFLAFILKSLHILSSKKLCLLCPPQESDITFLCALVNADIFRSTFNRTWVLSIEINSVFVSLSVVLLHFWCFCHLLAISFFSLCVCGVLFFTLFLLVCTLSVLFTFGVWISFPRLCFIFNITSKHQHYKLPPTYRVYIYPPAPKKKNHNSLIEPFFFKKGKKTTCLLVCWTFRKNLFKVSFWNSLISVCLIWLNCG